MKSALRRTTILALTAALSTGTVFAASKDKSESTAASPAAATVNGKIISKARLDILLAGQLAQGQPDSPELRNVVREELIRREVLSQEAQKKGIDKKTDVIAQSDMAKQQVVIGAYLQDYVRSNPITDEQIRKEYDAIKAQLGDKEYKARHILVETEAEAKTIIEKLNKGEKFEELAKQSKDPGSKDRGGDLGWAAPNSYVKAFSDSLVKLTKGAYTKEPVKSDFGYHVIQLEDVRELKLPTFEEAKPQIGQRLVQQLVEKHVRELRTKAKVD